MREQLSVSEPRTGEQTPLVESGSPGKSVSRTKLIIAGVVAVVLILALGLGLGLGLRSDSQDSHRFDTTCTSFSSSSKRHSERMHPSKWPQEDCPSNSLSCPKGFSSAPLILVSLDGFRADYILRNLTPTLDKIGDCGVRTAGMRSVFPTKTFPNHFSIVTGLYPESHGIIDNTMYDMELKKQFALSSDEKFNPEWWSGEPIWNTVTKSGKKSATFFWPGSEVIIDGFGPDYCYIYDESVPFEARVEQALDWLDLPEGDRPDFISIYFNQPDSAGHAQGPFGDQVNGNLTVVDELIGQLVDGIITRGLIQCVNLIVVSDHGMGPVEEEKCVHVSDRFSGDEIYDYYIYSGPFGRVTSQYKYNNGEIVHVKDGDTPDEILQHFQCREDNDTVDWHLKSYKKEDLPKRFHYANNHRIEEVVFNVADGLFSIRDPDGNDDCWNGGEHGYDNIFTSMQAFFVGMGPGFKINSEATTFENIELYNLMAELLGLEPAPNNGTLGSLRYLMSDPRDNSDLTPVLGSNYSSCPFPDDKTAAQRRNASKCSCDFSANTSKTVEELDSQLNLSKDEIAASESRHLVFGAPYLGLEKEVVCQLAQTEYITGHNHRTHLASWVAFTLKGEIPTSYPGASDWASDSEIANCSRTDIRIPSEDVADCLELTDQNLTTGFLYHPGFAADVDQSFDAYIVSNMVPMYRRFRTGTWKVLLELLEEYSMKFGQIQVYTGPIFDYNYDGRADSYSDIPQENFVNNGRVPIPSHYFAVAVRCDNLTVSAECVDSGDVLAVILPHKQTETNCWDEETTGQVEYIKNNVARVKDVELLTGLTFFPHLDSTARLRLNTHLAVGLWDRLTWIDQISSCPDLQPECPIEGYNETRPPVLLISLDGFRPDYLLHNQTPVLQKLSECGVSANYMNSVYPTLTFPNHYTIVTGLYPESHGIVDNNMYDTELNMSFSLGGVNSTQSAWWGGEPIWNVAEKQSLTSMAFMWVGSEVEIGGTRPTRYVPYNGNIPNRKRVDRILKWISGSENVLPDLLLLYFDDVDHAGHLGGPDSLQVLEALSRIDAAIGDLMDGLYRMNMHKCLNIIITSDHGMTDLSCEKQVRLNDYVPDEELKDLYVYEGGAGRVSNKYAFVSPDQRREIPESERVPVEDILRDTSCSSEHMKVYARADVPRRFHYARNERIDEIIAVMEEPWAVTRDRPWCPIKGQHGWDPDLDSMKALFISYGPSFKSHFTAEPFQNIEIFLLLSGLLDIAAPPNNGTEGGLRHILKSAPVLSDVAGLLDYENGTFPSGGDYESRINASGCRCGFTNEKLLAMDERFLNLTADNQTGLEKTHLPHGLPAHPSSDPLFVLYQDDYVLGYSAEYLMPRWAAFSAGPDANIVTDLPECLRSDVRIDLEFQPSCANFSNYNLAALFPSTYSSSNDSVPDSQILTNAVPMLQAFQTGIWNYLMTQTIRTWADTVQNLYVLLGPAFDYDADGLPDDLQNITRRVNNTIPVPSHYFAIVLQCPDNTGCLDMDYNAQAYLLPHKENFTNCMTNEQHLYDSRVRIRDIELVTGLEFLTTNRTLESVRSRIASQPSRWIQSIP